MIKQFKRWWLERKYPEEQLVKQVRDFAKLSTHDFLSFRIVVEDFKEVAFGTTFVWAYYTVIVNDAVAFRFSRLSGFSQGSVICLHRGEWCKELDTAHRVLQKELAKRERDKFIPLDELKKRKRSKSV